MGLKNNLTGGEIAAQVVWGRREAGHLPDSTPQRLTNVVFMGMGEAMNAARFVQMHFRDGELDGVRILDTDSCLKMREIRVPGKRFDLGLGWFRPSNARGADPPFVEHLGGGAGFCNMIRMYPTRGVGVAVMGNATKYDIDAVASLTLAPWD